MVGRFSRASPGVAWVGCARFARSFIFCGSYAPPPANKPRRHPRKSALFALRVKQVSPAPANVCGFRSQVGGGSCRPPCLGCRLGCFPLCAAPPSSPNYNARKFCCALGCVVRVLALAMRALLPACRPPGPPARFKIVKDLTRRAFTHHRPRGVVWAVSAPTIKAISLLKQKSPIRGFSAFIKGI